MSNNNFSEEEKERIRFLEKLEEDEGKGKEAKEIPIETFEFFPKKPPKRRKFFARISIVLTILAILSLVSTFFYWYFKIR